MNGLVLSFLALLLVVGAGALWFRAAQRVALPKNRSAFVAAWFGGALLGVIALIQGAGWIGAVPAVLAIVGGSFLTFLVSISRQKVAAGAISVGATLPDFTATDENGETFKASSLAGHPVLIKFFRGHW